VLSIIETFSEALIQLGLALEKAVSDAGFDAKTIVNSPIFLKKVTDNLLRQRKVPRKYHL
jgi:hypothetical protein